MQKSRALDWARILLHLPGRTLLDDGGRGYGAARGTELLRLRGHRSCLTNFGFYQYLRSCFMNEIKGTINRGNIGLEGGGYDLSLYIDTTR